MSSMDLKESQIKSVFGFGNDLVVFRGISGKVYVLNAYCPHLGANIGVGGTVVGDDIKCPFHGWTFNNEGKCVAVPGIESINIPKAEIKVWESIEVNDFIFVWNHSKGEKPNYLIKTNEDIIKNKFSGKVPIKPINNRIQDLMENIGDLVHVFVVHFQNPIQINLTQDNLELMYSFFKIIKINIKATWTASTIKHNSHTNVIQTVYLGPFIFKYNMNTYVDGPAYCHASHEFPGKNFIYSSVSVINISPNHVIYDHRVYYQSNRIISWIISKMFLYIGPSQILRDVLIWNKMKHLAHPYYHKNDPLKKFRTWYKQFY